MLYDIRIWINHLLTYLSLPPTYLLLTEKSIVLIFTVFLHKFVNINNFWHWFWLLFTYYTSKLQNLFTTATLPNDLKFLVLDYIILVSLLRSCLNQVIVENVIMLMISTGHMSEKLMLKPPMIKALDIWND